jgi:hypothetical protein
MIYQCAVKPYRRNSRELVQSRSLDRLFAGERFAWKGIGGGGFSRLDRLAAFRLGFTV